MVSDYPLFEQQNFDDVLWRVIQILGSSNSDLIYHSTGFLANVQHNNSNVKVWKRFWANFSTFFHDAFQKFLHDNKAVEDCMELLRTFAIHRNHPKFPGIVDNILLTLSNLISFPEDMKKYVYSACQRMMLVKDATSIFLNVLRISLGMKNSVQLAGRIFHVSESKDWIKHIFWICKSQIQLHYSYVKIKKIFDLGLIFSTLSCLIGFWTTWPIARQWWHWSLRVILAREETPHFMRWTLWASWLR